MTNVDAALAGFAGLDEAALARPWVYREKPMDVRYALYRTLEDAQEAHVVVAARPHPESRRILAFCQRAFGSLRGLVIGLPDTLLDREPRPGEWSVGETLRHVLAVERRYAIQTLYAVERADSDPVRIAADRLPPTGREPNARANVGAPGGVAEILAQLAEARAETNRSLDDIAPARMTRPTIWGQHDVDVRFRLHRFGAHVVEHTVQCEKTLAALGWRETEGRSIVRQLTALLGEIEGLGGLPEAKGVEARLVERFASVTGG
ncbi:MAG TPA: DinB family protein [Methylomirabilota bacterium]|jgi:hypothetical protein